MKKTHQISILLIAVIAILFTACGKSKYPGFKKTKKGLYYKFYTQNKEAKKGTVGDMLMCTYKIRTSDSTFMTSGGKPTYIPLDSNIFGDLFEGLKMLGVGDSATFIISADSIRSKHEIFELPNFIISGSAIYFDFKVTSIETKAEYEKEMIKKYKEKETKDVGKYLSDNKIDIKPTESGLYFIELKKGTGAKAENGKKVKVNYVGMFVNGRVFDTNNEDEAKKANIYSQNGHYGAPYEFELGNKKVIQGWDEAIAMMKVGGKAKLLIPSKLAYGDFGDGQVIPPCAPLVFEVELVSVEK